MPTYRPPLLGITQSQALAEAYASAPIGDPPLHTIALYHDRFVDESGAPTAVYCVNDYETLYATIEAGAPLHAGQIVAFHPIPYEFTLPEQTDSGAPPQVQLTVDNVSRELVPHLNAAAGSMSPITLIARTYLPSDTTAPHELPPLELVLRDIQVTVSTVTASAGYGDLSNRKFPSKIYSRDIFRSLAAK